MSTPTPLPATNNRFSILSEDDDDDVTVAMSNLSSDKDEPNDDATATTTTVTDDESSDDESPQEIRPYQIAFPTKQQAWCNLVQQQNLHNLPNASTIFNPKKLQYALFDSGATAHFFSRRCPSHKQKGGHSPHHHHPTRWLPSSIVTYLQPRHSLAPRFNDRSSYCPPARTFIAHLNAKIL